MVCTPIIEGGKAIGFACGPRKVCKCGSRKTPRLLCDWRVNGGTCDKPLCMSCTHVPAPGKDLCPDHAAEWKSRRA